jgi:myosin heavy subunit
MSNRQEDNWLRQQIKAFNDHMGLEHVVKKSAAKKQNQLDQQMKRQMEQQVQQLKEAQSDAQERREQNEKLEEQVKKARQKAQQDAMLTQCAEASLHQSWVKVDGLERQIRLADQKAQHLEKQLDQARKDTQKAQEQQKQEEQQHKETRQKVHDLDKKLQRVQQDAQNRQKLQQLYKESQEKIQNLNKELNEAQQDAQSKQKFQQLYKKSQEELQNLNKELKQAYKKINDLQYTARPNPEAQDMHKGALHAASAGSEREIEKIIVKFDEIQERFVVLKRESHEFQELEYKLEQANDKLRKCWNMRGQAKIDLYFFYLNFQTLKQQLHWAQDELKQTQKEHEVTKSEARRVPDLEKKLLYTQGQLYQQLQGLLPAVTNRCADPGEANYEQEEPNSKASANCRPPQDMENSQAFDVLLNDQEIQGVRQHSNNTPAEKGHSYTPHQQVWNGPRSRQDDIDADESTIVCHDSGMSRDGISRDGNSETRPASLKWVNQVQLQSIQYYDVEEQTPCKSIRISNGREENNIIAKVDRLDYT